MREKPSLKEVLEKTEPVKKLDLRGWECYAWEVAEVLRELKLIGETMEIKYPNIKPLKGFWGSQPLTEEYLAYLKSLEKETNQWLA